MREEVIGLEPSQNILGFELESKHQSVNMMFPVYSVQEPDVLEQVPMDEVDNQLPQIIVPSKIINSSQLDLTTVASTPEDIDGKDPFTGLTTEEANIPPEKNAYTIKQRKARKKDPGNNVKTALNLGRVGDDVITYNDNIGMTSGKARDKNDYYKFNLKGKENDVSIVVDGLKDNANLELRNKNGKSVLFNSTQKGKKPETIEQELAQGTYFLRVYPKGNAKTKYELSISAEEILQDPDSKSPGATNLGPLGKKKKVITDEIGFKEKGTRDNRDFYKFTLTEKLNNLNIVLDGLKDDANIQLLDEDGKTIIDQSRSKGKKKEIIDQILERGTYYLKVTPTGNARTKYRLSLDGDKIDDPDGTRTRAENLGTLGNKPIKKRDEIGFEVGGKRDQKDYYQFNLNRDSEVNLSLDGLNQNVDLKLLGSKGNLLYSSTNKGKDVEKISTILDKGKYYALVEPMGSDRSEYTLSIDGDSKIQDPDAKLPGKNLGKLKEKTISLIDDIGLKKKGFLDTSDFWRIELTKETDLTITLDRLSQNADLELYDKDGTTLIYSSKEKGKKPEEISSILDKGIYYIKVKSKGGSSSKYKLSVTGNTQIGEKDDALPGTNLGELGNQKIVKKDEIGFESSQNIRDVGDFYNFSLAEQRGVNITLDGLTGDANLFLVGNDGREIEVSNNKGKRNEIINEILQPGNYYIGVKPNGGKVKTNYNLEVTTNLQKDDFNNRQNAQQLGTLNLQDQVTQNNRVGFKEGSLIDQADFYSFKLTETSDVNLSLDGLDGDANLLLLDNKNTLDESTAKGLKAENIKKKLEAGTYYAAIFPVSGAKTDYELTLGVTQKTVDLSSLKFEALDVQDGLKAGERLKVNYQVNNIGNTKADAFEVGFYLSKDEGIDKGDFLLGTAKVKSLSGDQNTKKLAKQLTLPESGDNFWQGSGDYYLGMMVDVQDAIVENNELNNTGSQRVGVDVSSDLIVSGFDVQEKTVNPGQKFNAKVTLNNAGGKLDDFRVGFYVSEDNEITTSDELLDSKMVTSLGGKKSTTINKQLTLPVASVSGVKKYFIGAIADDQDVLREVNETNNVSKEKVSLSPVPQDNAGNKLNKGRKVGVLGNKTEKFSDWVGDFYGVSEDTHDYYKIELDERSRLNLNLKGLSTNANLYLYDSDGDLLQKSEESENKEEAIDIKLLPGTYYGLVWKDDGGNTNYDLEMSALPLKYPVPQITGWNRNTALNIGALSATPIAKTEYVGNPHGFVDDLNDFYKFQVEGSGSQVQIDLTGLNKNADLYLYNSESSSSSIARSETLQKADESIVKNLSPGTYFIEVQSINNAKTNYNLQVVGTPLPDNGAGENPDQALDLGTLGETIVNDWVGDIDGTDYYMFAVSENSTVDMSLTGMSGNANLKLFDNKEKSLSSSSQEGNADDGIAINLTPSNYFVEVERYSGVVGTPYNFQISATSRAEDLVGNDLETAKDIGALTTFNQTEWVGSFDVSDYYKFSLAEDSEVDLNLTGMNSNGQLYLYDSEGEVLTSSINDSNTDEAIITNLNPGTYYVWVWRYKLYSREATSVNYNLTASATTIPDSGGDTLETAGDIGDISTPKTLSNWVGSADPNDYYKFTLTEDSNVNLNLTGMDDNGQLYLYDSEGEVLTSSINDSNTDEAIITNLNPGTYYVWVWRYKLYSREATSVNYNLTASATTIPDSGGDTLETAGDIGDISTPKTLSNWVGSADPNDYYKFTLTEDSNVNLNLTGMDDNGQLYLYDSEGEVLTSSINDSNTDEAI
ncbi:MAG: pre-peptidase C-terminal domain-containing protein, partial [Trichodesmium sp. ALOHA_ZT_67]|nr:pre-peptidase C-terminal domain-containing protein [Trichodesmium sp. ALOHA_ZT_67]